jgi:hypothetical protein
VRNVKKDKCQGLWTNGDEGGPGGGARPLHCSLALPAHCHARGRRIAAGSTAGVQATEPTGWTQTRAFGTRAG